MERGITKNKVLTIDKILNEYYKFRSWDENGVPTKNKLKKLDIINY